MSDREITQAETSPDPTETHSTKKPTALQCLGGAAISAGFSALLYGLTLAIVTTFADKPISSTNSTAAKITVLVRTLVMGTSALATFVFAFVALGLIALGIQNFIKNSRSAA